MQEFWHASINTLPARTVRERDAPLHQPHDVYLRRDIISVPYISRSMHHNQGQDSQLIMTASRRDSGDSNGWSVSTNPEVSAQCRTQRSSLNANNAQWHVGNTNTENYHGKNVNDQFSGFSTLAMGPESVQYGPWDVNLRPEFQAATPVQYGHLQGYENTFGRTSATPTESDYSDHSFSTTSASSSFAASPEDWQTLQLHRNDSIDMTTLPSEYSSTSTTAPASCLQRDLPIWNQPECYWPAYARYEGVGSNCCADSGCGVRLLRKMPPDFISQTNEEAMAPTCTEDYGNHFPVWKDICWNFERLARPRHEHEQSQQESLAVKRTPQQARQATQEEIASTLEHDEEQRKPRETTRQDSSEHVNADPNGSKSATLAHVPAEKNNMLVSWRKAGLTYKEIKMRGEFPEAESTLRGRYRALTKQKHQRLRAPIWNNKDVDLLCSTVRGFLNIADHMDKDRVPWKKVAELIVSRGGTYLFGPSTCKKKWEELVKGGFASDK